MTKMTDDQVKKLNLIWAKLQKETKKSEKIDNEKNDKIDDEEFNSRIDWNCCANASCH